MCINREYISRSMVALVLLLSLAGHMHGQTSRIASALARASQLATRRRGLSFGTPTRSYATTLAQPPEETMARKIQLLQEQLAQTQRKLTQAQQSAGKPAESFLAKIHPKIGDPRAEKVANILLWTPTFFNVATTLSNKDAMKTWLAEKAARMEKPEAWERDYQ